MYFQYRDWRLTFSARYLWHPLNLQPDRRLRPHSRIEPHSCELERVQGPIYPDPFFSKRPEWMLRNVPAVGDVENAKTGAVLAHQTDSGIADSPAPADVLKRIWIIFLNSCTVGRALIAQWFRLRLLFYVPGFVSSRHKVLFFRIY